MNIKFIIVQFLSLFFMLMSCSSGQPVNYSDRPEMPALKNAKQQNLFIVKENSKDEESFRLFFKEFQKKLVKNKLDELQTTLNFPFFTGKDESQNINGLPIDPVSEKEYSTYKAAIFNEDVKRLLPAAKEENLAEISSKTDDPYYKFLLKKIDAESKMYEVYFQYPEQGSNAESYFGFIFGKVNGKYLSLARYSKWPVKG